MLYAIVFLILTVKSAEQGLDQFYDADGVPSEGLMDYLDKGTNIGVKVDPVKYVNPDDVVAMNRSVDCTTACGVLTPYIVDGVCTSDSTNADAKYCVEDSIHWDVDDETEYKSLLPLYNAGTLTQEEVDKMALTMANRMAALRAKPWTNGQPTEPQPEMQLRRRSYYTGNSCHGGYGGGHRSCAGCSGSRPRYMQVRSGSLVDALTFTYRNGGFVSGGGRGGHYALVYLPSCVTGAYIRTGRLLDGIQLIGRGWKSGYYGGRGGHSKYINAPYGKCLSSITLRTGRLVDRICFYWS